MQFRRWGELRTWLRQKSNFITMMTLGFGVPFMTIELWRDGGHGGLARWLFLVLLGIVVSLLFAYFMWLVFDSSVRKYESQKRDE
jgi:hypothetical protein